MGMILKNLFRLHLIIRMSLLILIVFLNDNSSAQEKRFITVASDGSGDFKTITEAIQSLPMFNYQRTEIYVKNGIYNEKIKIDQDYITLKGESREKTIIQFSQLRTDWIAKKDSIGPAVINLSGDDFILENMTIENTQPLIGPHAFTIYGTGTRTIILNSNIISKGGDTVSLWDYKTGMYYHANCYFEGAVDFVCPRGWCFIRDSKFYELKKTAAIWHAGGDNINQKFVIRNSSFNGVKGFELGRHHYEAQFYLLDCVFSDSMSEKPIYRVVNKDSTKNRPFNWGSRYYFFNCKNLGESLEWIKNNLNTASEFLKPEDITPKWTFDNRWDPESKDGPKIISYRVEKNAVIFLFDEQVTVIDNPILKSKRGETFYYNSGGGSNTIRFKTSELLKKEKLDGLNMVWGNIVGSTAGINTRKVNFNQLPNKY
jgi:pectinesterase